MKKFQSMLALLLAAALCLCSLTACGTASGGVSESIVSGIENAEANLETTPGTGASAVPQRTGTTAIPTFSDGVHADTDYADMEWYIYDPTEYYASIDKLAACTDGDEALKLYKQLNSEYILAATFDSLAYIEFYADPDDEELSTVCQEMDSMCTDMLDALYTALSTALDGDAGPVLEEYFGEENAQELRDYEEMTDRESEILDRISELQLEYNDLIMQSLTYTEMTEQIGGLYVELIGLYNEYAQLSGYDNYADYSYENVYGRDFTPEDSAVLCEAVKPYAYAYFSYLFSDEAACADFTVDTDYSTDELLNLLTTYMPRVSDKAAQAANYMVGHGLYYLGSADEISEIGYTTTLEYYNAPFIYNSLYGNASDIGSMFHEFGHYYEAYSNIPQDHLLNAGTYDIYEIHSNGMEALSFGWYDDIYGDEAGLAKIKYLDNALYSIVMGCMLDEFQRVVYSAENLTAEQVNDYFTQIAAEYGIESYSKSFATYWMQVSHNFEQPFYYISYAVSAIAALQIYEMAEDDWDEAAAFYNDLVDLGAVDYTYCELLEKVGLESFTNGLPDCVGEAVEDMAELCNAYDSAA